MPAPYLGRLARTPKEKFARQAGSMKLANTWTAGSRASTSIRTWLPAIMAMPHHVAGWTFPRTLRSCKIDFVYAGFEPEDLFWDGEACATVRAEIVDQTGLERLGKWQRLDDFELRHMNQLPGGKVLYV
jgi:hypothetical protein